MDRKRLCRLGIYLSLVALVCYIVVIAAPKIVCRHTKMMVGTIDVCMGFWSGGGTNYDGSTLHYSNDLNECESTLTSSTGMDQTFSYSDTSCSRQKASVALYILAALGSTGIICAFFFAIRRNMESVKIFYISGASLSVSLIFGMPGFSLMVDEFLTGDGDGGDGENWGYAAVFGLLAWTCQAIGSIALVVMSQNVDDSLDGSFRPL